MSLTQILTSQWLNTSQAKIYLELLSLWSAPASSIARRLSIPKSTVFSALKELEHQQYVSSIKEKKTQIFRAVSPKIIFDLIKQKTSSFENHIPLLLDMMQNTSLKPWIQFFEWEEWVKRMYMQQLEWFRISWQKHIKAFYGQYQESTAMYSFFHEYYIPERKKLDVRVDVLMTNNQDSKTYHETKDEDFYKISKIISDSSFALPLSINLYDNTIAVWLYDQDDMYWFIIQSEKFYTFFIAIFDYIWSRE